MKDLTMKTVRKEVLDDLIHYAFCMGIWYSYSKVGEFWQVHVPVGTWPAFECRK